jgi:hypothetical protein
MRRSHKSTQRGEAGRGLIGLVVAMGLLGVVAAVVLVAQSGGSHDLQGLSPSSTINGSPANAAGDIHLAAEADCRYAYAGVTAAVADYEVVNGRPPTDMAALRPMLRGPINSSRFVISLNPTRLGQVEVAAPGHPATPGDAACTYAG